ncbi:TPA: hypothetical protein JS394_002073 [Serratia rubidaea]|nr:hypothetical protein I6G83_15440 [Serratia rubidaea]HAY0637100.1 hypothetical protein [Serratia rubidaea]
MMALIGQEPHGSWLAGTNNMWHGGIHISEISAPGSVLKPNMAETAVPLQCMADGEVVAWRLNKDYQRSTYLDQPVQYTTTFVLVKSTCLPDKSKEQTQLDFYSLYMGLAPLSAFEKRKCMVAQKEVTKREVGKYESSRQSGDTPHAPKAIGRLPKGARLLILEETEFLNKPVSPKTRPGTTELQPFGLAQAFDKNGKLTEEKFWVTLLPGYMTEEGEQYAHLPFWMQKAVEQGIFDAVTKPATALKISAGDAIGFLGEDIAPMGKAKTSRSTYAHIEVLSADSRMPAFLDNPGKVTAGRKYIRVHPTAKLYTLSGSTFSNTGNPVEKDRHIILPVDKCNPKKSGGKSWYQVGQSYWLSQDDVDLIDQYNLKELGFTALAEETTPDMSASLQEGWMKSGLGRLAEQVRPERGIREQQMSSFYKGMLEKMDTDKDGQLSERELFAALQHPEMGVRDIVARMIVKHQSEWFGGSSHQKWTAFFQNYDTLRIGFVKKWLDDMEWMSQVEPFSSGQAVWHMHPVVFLDAIGVTSQIRITVDMLYKVFEGLRSPAKKEFLQQFADEINNNVENYKLDTLQRVNHFFAQVREEMGGTASPIEGLNYSEEGLKVNFKYFRKHPDEARKYSYKKTGDKITTRADETAIANRVYANRLGNGNVASGDGSKYRGRGGVHLTGKVNYKGFSSYYKKQWGDGVDFIEKPYLLERPVYCVRAAVYFWLRENLYAIADVGSAGAIVDKITAKVNLHTDSYEKRRKHFENIMNKKMFVEGF